MKWGHCGCPVFDCDMPEPAHSEYGQHQYAPSAIRHDRFASAPPAPVPAPAPSTVTPQRDFRSRNRSSERLFAAGRPMRSRAQSFDEKSRLRNRTDEYRVDDLARRLDYQGFHDTIDHDDEDEDARTEAYTRSVYKGRFDTQRSRQPSRTRAEDDFAIRPRRRRSFVVDDFERAGTDILPPAPQPPPPPPSPPQQKAQAESVIVHRYQPHHQQYQQHQQHQQHQAPLPPQPDMHPYQQPHMQHMQHMQQHMPHAEPRPRQVVAPSQHPGEFYSSTATRPRPAPHVDSEVGRLAGRFNKDPRSSPMHRSTQPPPPQPQGLPIAPMTAPMTAPMNPPLPMGMAAPSASLMGAMPPHMPPMIGMGPQSMPPPPNSIHPMAMMPISALPSTSHIPDMRMMRQYMIEDDPYAQSEFAAMYPGSQVPFPDTTPSRHYDSPDAEAFASSGGMNRRMRRREDAALGHQVKPSDMAGLGGFGRGMDRVSEWMAYVGGEPPEEVGEIASSVEA